MSNALPSQAMRGPKSPFVVSDRDGPLVLPGGISRPAIPPLGIDAHTARNALPFHATSGMPAFVANVVSVDGFGKPSLPTTIACTAPSAVGQVMAHGVTHGSFD